MVSNPETQASHLRVHNRISFRSPYGHIMVQGAQSHQLPVAIQIHNNCAGVHSLITFW